MRTILYWQIFVYLLFSPVLMSLTDPAYILRIDIFFVVLISFFVGGLLARFFREKGDANYNVSARPFAFWFFLIATVVYVWVVYEQGLLDRRQGSEQMAAIYAGIPSLQLIALRMYEIIYYPFVLMVVFCRRLGASVPYYFYFSAITGFFFSGVLSSRSKLLIPIVLSFIFLYGYLKNVSFQQRLCILFIVFFFCLLAFGVVLYRIEAFGSLSEYLYADFVQRFDGLSLVSMLDSQLRIPFYGLYDLSMFNGILAMFPFSEYAVQLKLAGYTSTKAYFLSDVLCLEAIDINNSSVTDLFYFAGYIGVSMGFILLGMLAKKVDFIINAETILRSRFQAALLIAFVLAFFRLEMDFFSMFISCFRDFIIIYMCFYMFRFNGKALRST